MKSFIFASLATVAVLAITANADSGFSGSNAVYVSSSTPSNPLAKRQEATDPWCKAFYSVCPQAAAETCGFPHEYLQNCVSQFVGDKCVEYKALCICRTGPNAPVKEANTLALQKTFAITNGACSELSVTKEPYDPNKFGNNTTPTTTQSSTAPTQGSAGPGTATQKATSPTTLSGSPSAVAVSLTSTVLVIAGSLSAMFL
ncbi:hypothetical protein BGZ76_005742 [Entomortierella beljakovae]|nr:hypothetical protein BGZ76_005742 [Entomortierella beljakovae]